LKCLHEVRQAYGRDSTADWMIDAGEYLKTLPINEIIVDLC